MNNRTLFVLPLILFGNRPTLALVTPSPLFSDNCVLQTAKAVPIWGTAEAGEKVTVDFPGQHVSTTAAPDGTWSVKLKDLKSGGPFELVMAGSGNSVTAKNVLVGEVWMCAGQSNMERQLGPRSGQPLLDNWEKEAAAADFRKCACF